MSDGVEPRSLDDIIKEQNKKKRHPRQNRQKKEPGQARRQQANQQRRQVLQQKRQPNKNPQKQVRQPRMQQRAVGMRGQFNRPQFIRPMAMPTQMMQQPRIVVVPIVAGGQNQHQRQNRPILTVQQRRQLRSELNNIVRQQQPSMPRPINYLPAAVPMRPAPFGYGGQQFRYQRMYRRNEVTPVFFQQRTPGVQGGLRGRRRTFGENGQAGRGRRQQWNGQRGGYRQF